MIGSTGVPPTWHRSFARFIPDHWKIYSNKKFNVMKNERKDSGWLWSEQLGLGLGKAEYLIGEHTEPLRVVRFFDAAGWMLPTEAEAAIARAQREAAARRAAEEEIARLKALLQQQ